MTEYLMATVRGQHDVLVVEHQGSRYWSAAPVPNQVGYPMHCHPASEVTDLCPVIVTDRDEA